MQMAPMANSSVQKASDIQIGDAGSDFTSELLSSVRAEFDRGVTRCLAWRMAQLQGLRRMMEERRGEVEEAVAEDMGRCAAETVGEVLKVWTDADMAIRNLHRWTKEQRLQGSPIFPLGSFSSERQPLGVALIIAPWNFPVGEEPPEDLVSHPFRAVWEFLCQCIVSSITVPHPSCWQRMDEAPSITTHWPRPVP